MSSQGFLHVFTNIHKHFLRFAGNIDNRFSSTLFLQITDADSEAEDDQLLELKLSDFEGVLPGTQISSLITLVSDDAAIKIEEIVVEVRESTVDSQTVVVIRRIGPLEQEISVAYKTMDGTAISSGFNNLLSNKGVIIAFAIFPKPIMPNLNDTI